jgi:hypothetical protein
MLGCGTRVKLSIFVVFFCKNKLAGLMEDDGGGGFTSSVFDIWEIRNKIDLKDVIYIEEQIGLVTYHGGFRAQNEFSSSASVGGFRRG